MTTSVKIILIILAAVCLGFAIAFIVTKSDLTVLKANITPLKHWHLLPNGTYTLPIKTNLYLPSANTDEFTFVGTVASHYSEFMDDYVDDALERFHYDNIIYRKTISVEILAGDAADDIVKIRSQKGYIYAIKRSEHEDFPSSVLINFPKAKLPSKEIEDKNE